MKDISARKVKFGFWTKNQPPFFDFLKLIDILRKVYILLKNLSPQIMGSKHQKKLNNCPFRGKEKIALESTIQAIRTHIPIETCGTFTPDDIITTTVGMCSNKCSPTEVCKIPGTDFPSSTTYRTCLDTLELDTLVTNNVALFSEFSHQFLKKENIMFLLRMK